MRRKKKGKIPCDKLKQIQIGFLGLARCVGTSSGAVLWFFPMVLRLGWSVVDPWVGHHRPYSTHSCSSRVGKEGCFGDILMLGKYF